MYLQNDNPGKRVSCISHAVKDNSHSDITRDNVTHSDKNSGDTSIFFDVSPLSNEWIHIWQNEWHYGFFLCRWLSCNEKSISLWTSIRMQNHCFCPCSWSWFWRCVNLTLYGRIKSVDRTSKILKSLGFPVPSPVGSLISKNYRFLSTYLSAVLSSFLKIESKQSHKSRVLLTFYEYIHWYIGLSAVQS